MQQQTAMSDDAGLRNRQALASHGDDGQIVERLGQLELPFRATCRGMWRGADRRGPHRRCRARRRHRPSDDRVAIAESRKRGCGLVQLTSDKRRERGARILGGARLSATHRRAKAPTDRVNRQREKQCADRLRKARRGRLHHAEQPGQGQHPRQGDLGRDLGGLDRPLGGPRHPLRDRDRRRRPAFLRRAQSGAAPEHHRGRARIPAHPADLLAARRHRARPEDRGRWPHGRPLPARLEAGHRRRQRLGGRRRALHGAGLDRHPHRQPRACAVQIRADDAGLARPRPRREPVVEAAPLHRRDEDAADRRPGRCRGGLAHRPRSTRSCRTPS